MYEAHYGKPCHVAGCSTCFFSACTEPGEQGKLGGGRVTVKFPRAAVQDVLDPGDVELTVAGELRDGSVFEGTDIVRVIDPGK